MQYISTCIAQEKPYKVIYLDTYSIVGHMHTLADGQKRVELSQYLKDYPELHATVLRHEIEHAQIGGKIKWQHMLFDIRDRASWMTDPLIWAQFRAFRKKARRRMNVQETLMFIVCMEISGFADLAIQLVAGPIRAYRRYKRRRITRE